MSELFDTINMKALDSDEIERVAAEERLTERKRAIKARRDKATKTLLTRTGISAAICAALWLAGKFDLMADNLVLCLYAAIFSWLCIWVGAWIQFMWCKGGLLEW